MKKPKRINSKRPSLWVLKGGILRIYYPNGYVEYFDLVFDEWRESCLSKYPERKVIKYLKNHAKFMGYL